METRELFDVGQKKRKPPRVLMHVCDASHDEPDATHDSVVMLCPRCQGKTAWITLRRSEAKRGIPCPNCNGERKEANA
jgi:DNA-directed RNA polymerase subunit RPC12/RpoP